MSGAPGQGQLLDSRWALDAYLDQLLSAGAPVADAQPQGADAGLEAGFPPGAPPWVQGDFRVRLFQVAGLTLALPLARVKEVVVDHPPLAPASDDTRLLLGVLPRAGGHARVIDTRRLVLPQEPAARLREDASRRAGCLVFVDEGHWALACSQVGEVIELQPGQVTWRTAAGKRRWLAGTEIDRTCAVLDLDGLIGILDSTLA